MNLYPKPRFSDRDQMVVDYAMILDSYQTFESAAKTGHLVSMPVVAADSVLRAFGVYLVFLRQRLGLPETPDMDQSDEAISTRSAVKGSQQ